MRRSVRTGLLVEMVPGEEECVRLKAVEFGVLLLLVAVAAAAVVVVVFSVIVLVVLGDAARVGLCLLLHNLRAETCGDGRK